MNLRVQAELDLAATLEDETHGFGIAATITDPDGKTAELKIQSGDVHLLLDPGTNVQINNRTAHAAIRISSLSAAGLSLPRAQPNQAANPWILEFADVNGNSRKFTIQEPRPDRTLGLITVILELITG